MALLSEVREERRMSEEGGRTGGDGCQVEVVTNMRAKVGLIGRSQHLLRRCSR
jgi:hypothetical protein